jgi:hypothetical protein
MKLLANEGGLYVVTLESPSWTPSGFSARLATHVFVLPADYTYSQSVALDLSGDQHVSPVDALLVINALNEHPDAALFDLPAVRQAVPKIDTNGDGELSPADALLIINYLNDSSTAGADDAGVAEGEAASSISAVPMDDYFSLLGSDNPRRKR